MACGRRAIRIGRRGGQRVDALTQRKAAQLKPALRLVLSRRRWRPRQDQRKTSEKSGDAPTNGSEQASFLANVTNHAVAPPAAAPPDLFARRVVGPTARPLRSDESERNFSRLKSAGSGVRRLRCINAIERSRLWCGRGRSRCGRLCGSRRCGRGGRRRRHFRNDRSRHSFGHGRRCHHLGDSDVDRCRARHDRGAAGRHSQDRSRECQSRQRARSGCFAHA
jgi:hypothetical protein